MTGQKNKREKTERKLEYSGNEKSKGVKKREEACTTLQNSPTIKISFKK